MTPTELQKANLGIGARLRETRKARGLTQAKLGEFAGSNAAVIQKLESSEILSPRMVVELAIVLDVSPAWLQWGNPYASTQVIQTPMVPPNNRLPSRIHAEGSVEVDR